MSLKDLWGRVFGQKYYLAPDGYDPTVDELPAALGPASRGEGGAWYWLKLGGLLVLMAALVWFVVWKVTTPAAAASAGAEPAGTPGRRLGLLAPTGRPTQTPIVFPTFGGVVTITPAPTSAATITPVVGPTRAGGPVYPTNTPPPQGVPTSIRYQPPAPTAAAPAVLPTNTPPPTPTRPPPTLAASPTATPSATASPTDTASPSPSPCPPTATPSATVSPTDTPTPTPTAEATSEAELEPTATPTPEPSPTLEQAEGAPSTAAAWLYVPLVLRQEAGGC